MLSRILAFCEETNGATSVSAARLHHVLGLLHLYGSNGADASAELERAMELYRDAEGPDSTNVQQIAHEMEIYL